jgi:hypothetical protein
MSTKITLSDKEHELVCNSEWILTKHTIIQKVYALFGSVLPLLESEATGDRNFLPEEVFKNAAKISKGENYKLLPYVMLDYPRYFGNDDTIAIRTFFWWGNFFSVSLQLTGKYKADAIDKLLENFEWLQQNGYAVCINESPWEHHFEESNFIPLQSINYQQFETILAEKTFVKIAKNMALSQWQEVPAFIVKSFTELINLLKK